MEETKVDFVPEKETKNSGKSQAKCFHCKENARSGKKNALSMS